MAGGDHHHQVDAARADVDKVSGWQGTQDMDYRLFVAITLPDDQAARLHALSYGVPGARWIAPEQLHLTLRFVGACDGAEMRDLIGALDRIQLPAFELTLAGAGHFPPGGAPSNLWIGVAPNAALDALRRAVDRAVTALGHTPTRHRWTPHVTIARLKGSPPRKVAEFEIGQSLYRGMPFEVDRFSLMSSELHHSGALYSEEACFPLDR